MGTFAGGGRGPRSQDKILSDALAGAGSGRGPGSRMVAVQNAAWVFMGMFAAGYLLFQKKLLPFKYARLAAKLFFWPTIPITILNRWSNYWTAVDGTLIMGAAPLAPLGHVETLRDLGVTGVINLCDEYRGPVKLYEKYGIEQLHIPTVDHFEPKVDDLRRAVDFIRLREKKGERCFVHCKAGHGRSAAVALSWLITQNPGVPTQQLNQRLSEKRKVRKTLYKQSCIKGFLKSTGAGGDGKGLLDDGDANEEEDDRLLGGEGGIEMVAPAAPQQRNQHNGGRGGGGRIGQTRGGGTGESHKGGRRRPGA